MLERESQHQASMQVLLNDHQTHVAELRGEWQQVLTAKDAEIAENQSAMSAQASQLDSLQARVSELEAAAQRVSDLEHLTE